MNAPTRVSDMLAHRGRLLYLSGGLWSTDGTTTGTHKVRTINAEETLANGTPITGRALYTDRRLGPIDSFPSSG